MEITVVTGPTTYYAGKNLISKINASDKKRHFCLVPDRFSLQVESLIMDTLNLKSTFNIEVLGLSRLASRVLKEMGFVGKSITSDESLLLTAQAIDNQKEQFKSFKKTSISFAQEVEKVIQQFKSCCLTPEQVMPNHCRQSLKNKYHDLSLIYGEYQDLIGNRLDENKLLLLFGQMVQNSDILKNTNLYLIGFDNFTTEMFSLITFLAKSANHLYIALPRAISFSNGYIFEDAILKRLTQLCKESGLTVRVEEGDDALTLSQKDIAQNLFASSVKASIQKEYFLPVSCQNIMQEVLTAGKFINYAVRNGGSYKDYVIACSDLDKYLPLVQRCFKELDIPYFADKSITADVLILPQAIFKFLKVVSSGFSSQALADFFSQMLLAGDRTDQILGIISQFNIHGKAKTFKYISAVAPEELDLLEKLCRAQSCGQICECVELFCQHCEDKYQEVLQMLEKDYVQQARLNQQAQTLVQDALDAIKTYRADHEVSANEFSKILKLLLSFNQVSTVPTYVDSVMVADATSSYFSECENLIVLGGDQLPKIIQDNGLVTDDDIENLDFVRKLEPSIRVLNRRNRFKLFNLLCLAKRKLILMFKSFSDDGKKIEMPSYIKNLCNIFGQTPIRAGFIFQSMDERDEAFVAGLGSKALACQMLAGAASERLTDRQFSSLNDALKFDLARLSLDRENLSPSASELFFKGGRTSVSELECYFSCPFKHFLRYGLRLNEERQFGPIEIGNVCHKMAEIFINKNKNAVTQFGDDDVQKFVLANLEGVLQELDLVQTLENLDEQEYVRSYLARQCVSVLNRICYEQKHSKFKPKFTELKLEGAALEIGRTGRKLALSGKVDRVDVFDKYFRIIDYKTGKVGSIIKDLFYGDKLQLFIYQKGIQDMTGLSPSGVFYFDCKFDFGEEGSALLKGLLADNEQVIQASDDRLGVQEKSDLLSVAIRKNQAEGKFKGSAISKGNFFNLQSYAQKLSSVALEEIEGGYVCPKPDDSSCEKCAFKGVCLYAGENGYRKKSKVDQTQIENLLKGGEDGTI